jgi:hypothetical protein
MSQEQYVKLGNTVLPNDLAIQLAREWSGVEQEQRRSIGGHNILFTRKLYAGRPITLIGTESTGYIQNELYTELLGLSYSVGAVLSLTYYGLFFPHVVFRHIDSPVVFGEQIVQHGGVYEDDYYKNVQIKLMEV